MRMQRGPSEESEGRGAAKGRAKKSGITFIVALAAIRRAAQAAPKSIEDAKEGPRVSQARQGRVGK
jgi:hypothetical protein